MNLSQDEKQPLLIRPKTTSGCSNCGSCLRSCFCVAALAGTATYFIVKKTSAHSSNSPNSNVCQNTAGAYLDATLHVVWDSGENRLEPAPFADDAVAAKKPQIVASFITAVDQKCQAAFGGIADYTPPFGLPVIQAYQNQGGEVLLSFGGATGTYLQDVCSAEDLKTQVQQILTTYSIKKLDFDIEGAALGNVDDIRKLAAVLAEFQQADSSLEISLTLPVAPFGLTQDGLNAAQAFQAAQLNFKLNLMVMDFGNCQDMAACAIAAANTTSTQTGISHQNLILTPMIGVNDDNEVFTLDDAAQLQNFCAEQGCSLRYWSFDRDHSGNDLHSNDNSGAVNGVPVQTEDFQFATTLGNCSNSVAISTLSLGSSLFAALPSLTLEENPLNSGWAILAGSVLLGSFFLANLCRSKTKVKTTQEFDAATVLAV